MGTAPCPGQTAGEDWSLRISGCVVQKDLQENSPIGPEMASGVVNYCVVHTDQFQPHSTVTLGSLLGLTELQFPQL